MAGFDLRKALRIGLLFGIVAVSISAIGMVETFDERDVIAGYLTLGQLLLFAAPIIAGYYAVNSKPQPQAVATALMGIVAGFLTALPVVGLILLSVLVPDIRDMLVNVSSNLIEILTFGLGPTTGSVVLTIVMSVLGLAGAVFSLLPQKVERPILVGVMCTLGIGILSEVLLNVLRNFFDRDFIQIFFAPKGITPLMAVLTFVIAALLTAIWDKLRAFIDRLPRKIMRPLIVGIIAVVNVALLSELIQNGLSNSLSEATLDIFFTERGITPLTAVLVFIIGAGAMFLWDRNKTPRQYASKRERAAVGVNLVLLLPLILGIYLTEVADVVGIFILMGLGLNIVVGFAGLLDLGYVAFFAIGAYVMGLLTTEGDIAIANFTFWTALPFSVLTAVFFGVMLGVPVLRMRGDYLAIVTLGFGEIIRVLAVSDLLKPIIGGAQGITQLRKPQILDFTFVEPIHFYYIIVIAIVIAIFVSTRLRDARLGRRWMAMREDEDVAEAMGIHLVSTKLLAFGIGAAFSGFAGAIFAARLSSIFPHSFNLLISINVLSLIIVGGIGSLPGVVVGALVLIGLPEVLREFAEYRLLLYGALLIATMLLRPEGLWPSPIRKRELHATDEEAEHEGIQPEQVHDLI